MVVFDYDIIYPERGYVMKSKKKQVTVMLEPRVIKRLNDYAKKNGDFRSRLMRVFIERGLVEAEKKNS